MQTSLVYKKCTEQPNVKEHRLGRAVSNVLQHDTFRGWKHPSFGSLWLLFVALWASNQCADLSCAAKTSHLFQMRYLGRVPLKPLRQPQPSSCLWGAPETGWQEDVGFSSASFPPWRPAGSAGTLHRAARAWKAWGTAALPQNVKPRLDSTYRAVRESTRR